jgi:hypothetical protein
MRRVTAAASLATLASRPAEAAVVKDAPAREGDVTQFFAAPPAAAPAAPIARPASMAALEPSPAPPPASRGGIWRMPMLGKARDLAARLFARRATLEPEAANPRFEQFQKRRRSGANSAR